MLFKIYSYGKYCSVSDIGWKKVVKEILKLCFYFLHIVKMYSMCFSWLQKLHKQNLGNTGKYRGRYSKINILYIVLVYFLNLVIKCIYNIKSYIQIICACGLYYIYIFFYNNIFIYVLHMLVFCGGIEGMATHSSILAWRILWTEEPRGLQSMGSQTLRHD